MQIGQKVFLDFSSVRVPEQQAAQANEMLSSAVEKTMAAFEGSNIDIVLDRPEVGDYTTIDVSNSIQNGAEYLGIAQYDQTFDPSDAGQVRLDNIMKHAQENSLSIDQTSNLVSNTICHETAHTLGLDDNQNPTDTMYGGVSDEIINAPPTFSEAQLDQMTSHAFASNYPLESQPHGFEDYTSDQGDNSNNLADIEHSYDGDNDMSDADNDNSPDYLDDQSPFELL